MKLTKVVNGETIIIEKGSEEEKHILKQWSTNMDNEYFVKTTPQIHKVYEELLELKELMSKIAKKLSID
jgi:hypothetical protein